MQVAAEVIDGVRESAADAFKANQTLMGTIAAWMIPYTCKGGVRDRPLQEL